MVWNGGEGCDLYGLWLVMLKSAKDRVLGVDSLGQQVLPRVRYGTACLLIRDAYLCKVYNCHDRHAVWDPLLTRWYGLDGIGMVLV
jgi:hypothetical protein